MNKRFLRASAAAALAVAMTFGAVAPASAAKQPTRKAQTVKTAKAAKVSKAEKVLEATRRKVLGEVVRDDRALVRLLDRPSVLALDADAISRLGASVAADRTSLADAAAAARAATTLAEVREVAADVRELRPQTYSIVVGTLHDLASLAEAADVNVVTLADLETAVAEREAAGADVTAIRADLATAVALNDEAALAVPVAREAALLLTATSPRPEIQAVSAEVDRIAGLLDGVAASVELVELALAALVGETAAAEETAPVV